VHIKVQRDVLVDLQVVCCGIQTYYQHHSLTHSLIGSLTDSISLSLSLDLQIATSNQRLGLKPITETSHQHHQTIYRATKTAAHQFVT
jgi:hypothetical protein